MFDENFMKRLVITIRYTDQPTACDPERTHDESFEDGQKISPGSEIGSNFEMPAHLPMRVTTFAFRKSSTIATAESQHIKEARADTTCLCRDQQHYKPLCG